MEVSVRGSGRVPAQLFSPVLPHLELLEFLAVLDESIGDLRESRIPPGYMCVYGDRSCSFAIGLQKTTHRRHSPHPMLNKVRLARKLLSSVTSAAKLYY